MLKKYNKISSPHHPVWANAERTHINITISIDGLNGEHLFTAGANDPESYGIELYEDIIAGVFGPIAEYVPPSLEETAALVRYQRDQMLAATDWTQMPDIPQATKDLWQPYRQALRDIPQQAEFPYNIVWPTQPTA